MRAGDYERIINYDWPKKAGGQMVESNYITLAEKRD